MPEYYHGEDQPPELTTVTPDGRHLCGYYPDYLNDLNAMHEAEDTIRDNSWAWLTYMSQLNRIPSLEDEWLLAAVHATAAQRAEAFLKTLELWKP
jgi:hypothetical protein